LYRKLSWVLAAVAHVASEAALTKFSVETMAGEEAEEVKNHPFEQLLKRPNPLDSRYEFIYSTVAMKKLTGNAYWWMNKTNENAKPDELWLIPSHMIEPLPDAKMYIRGYAYYPGDGATIVLEPWEICHFRSFNPFNRFVGLSAIESLVYSVEGDLGMKEWMARLYKENNARLPGIITFESFPGDDVWKEIKKDMVDSAKKRQYMMLRGVGQGGVNLLQSTANPKDMELLAAIKSGKEEIWTVLAPGLSSMLDVNATEANAVAGRATFRERAVYPELVTIGEKVTTSVLPAYGDNLFGSFEDIRYVDRQLKLQEMAEYSKSHTVEEVRKEYYSDKPLGDERDQLLPQQIAVDSGQPEPENTETVPPVEQNKLKPDEIKALVEIDKWSAKSEKAGKLTVWHNVSIPDRLYNAIKSGEMAFDEARGRIRSVAAEIPGSATVLDGIRAGVEALKATKQLAPAAPSVTIHNYPEGSAAAMASVAPEIAQALSAEIAKLQISVKAPQVTVNVPEQPAPVINLPAPASNPPDETADVVKIIRKLVEEL